MQKTQLYNGTTPVTVTSRSRAYSYGTTSTFAQLDDLTDFINATIAAFLVSCGVDAAYEQRASDDEKWLYIWDIPFLAITRYYAGSSCALNLMGPYGMTNGSMIQPYSSASSTTYSDFGANVWTSQANGTYNFGLNFVGSPVNGFCLRLVNPSTMETGYCRTTTSTFTYYCPFSLRIFKCTNMANGNDAVAWYNGLFYSGNYACEKYFSSDVVNHVMQATASNSNYGRFAGDTTEYQKSISGNKMPLLPMILGTLKSNGVYQFLPNYNLPSPVVINEPTQTEATLGGHTFVQTQMAAVTSSANENPSNTYINMGMIDTTNDP